MAEQKTLRNKRLPHEHIIVGSERKALLESWGWYRNMASGWVHPHCMDLMSRHEILSLTPAQLDYKLTYGSRAMLPVELKRTAD